jgi:hypothetical protein
MEEGERDRENGLEERERSSVGGKRKWRGLILTVGKINTRVFLETRINTTIYIYNCQSRFGWFRKSLSSLAPCHSPA